MEIHSEETNARLRPLSIAAVRPGRAELLLRFLPSFPDGRVEVFDSVNHAPEEELRQAFDFLADACKS
jgi:hypothetical protein